MESLTKKTTASLLWLAAERLGNQAITFCVQILLARLIAPEEFGLLALLSILIFLSQVLIDGGFSQALIQKKSVDRLDVSTAFFSNLFLSLFLSLLLYGAIFCFAPLIAAYYEEPRLVLLVRVLGITLLVGAFGKTQNCMLVRDLQFKKLFRITLPSVVISAFIGVSMALKGFEVWALVALQVSRVLLLNISYWILSNRDTWPKCEFSFRSLADMGRFGIGLLASSLLYQGVQDIYGLVIGKAFSFGELGFYNRVRGFHRLPALSLTQVFNRVMFPVFSSIQSDDDRVLAAIRRGIPVVAFVVFPLMAFLMCAAEEVVVILQTKNGCPPQRT